MFKLKEKEGIKYYTIEEFSQTDLVDHAFTTKVGGVSQDKYAELNLGLHVEDKVEDVLKNRELICQLLDANSEKLVAGKQVHKDQIRVITDQDQGQGALNYNSAIEETDALITNKKGILLTSYYADCTPILILDPAKEAIGLAHAGWKGTVKKIAQKTILKMGEVYGTEPAQVLVGIGPAIGDCCYEVDSKVIEPLAKNFANWNQLVTEEGVGKWKLNLSLANRTQLEEIGVKAENIIESRLCTACHSDLFFSYRRDNGKTGRMASLIKLR